MDDKKVLELVNRDLDAFVDSARQRLSAGKNPFEAETRLLADFRHTSEKIFEKNWTALLTVFPATPPAEGRFSLPDIDFYYAEFQKSLHPAFPAHRRFSSVLEHFCETWETSLFHKINQWELAVIDTMRREFLEELYQKIETLKQLQQLLMPDSPGAVGRLWDMNKGKWQQLDLSPICHYAELLENDPWLQELCENLGRMQQAEIEYEEELFTEIRYIPDLNSEYSQKAEITGIRQSDDLDSMVPSEIAFMADAGTEALFFKKYTEKKLLTYEYQTKMFASQEVKTKSKRLKAKEYKGPFVICLDTSGSMHGTPETVAKTLCLAFLKIALRDRRKCYIISFSTEIETLDASNINDNIESFIAFLAMSFHGGTDASRAMWESLHILETDSFRKADIIVISDFIMGGFDTELLRKIEQAKRQHTMFHGLVIGKSANQKALECFNHVWRYGKCSINYF